MKTTIDAIEIIPAASRGRVVKEGEFFVWEPELGLGAVSEDEIGALIEDDREKRLDEIPDRARR